MSFFEVIKGISHLRTFMMSPLRSEVSSSLSFMIDSSNEMAVAKPMHNNRRNKRIAVTLPSELPFKKISSPKSSIIQIAYLQCAQILAKQRRSQKMLLLVLLKEILFINDFNNREP